MTLISTLQPLSYICFGVEHKCGLMLHYGPFFLLMFVTYFNVHTSLLLSYYVHRNIDNRALFKPVCLTLIRSHQWYSVQPVFYSGRSFIPPSNQSHILDLIWSQQSCFTVIDLTRASLHLWYWLLLRGYCTSGGCPCRQGWQCHPSITEPRTLLAPPDRVICFNHISTLCYVSY